MAEVGSESTGATKETEVERLTAEAARLTKQVDVLGTKVLALGDQLEATTLTVRIGQVLGPLMLLVLGAVTPLVGFKGSDYDDPDHVYSYLDALYTFTRRGPSSFGNMDDAAEASSGWGMSHVALIVLAVGLVGAGLTCWFLLFDRPGVASIVAVSVSGSLVLLSLVLLMLGRSSMTSIDPVGPFVGFWLLGAGAVWLLFGAWDANTRRAGRR